MIKQSVLCLVILLNVLSCSSSQINESVAERTPANLSENCHDIITLFFNKSAYGENKSVIRTLIDKIIILSNGKIAPKESEKFRLRSHQALFNYFFPKNDLPATIGQNEIIQLNKVLFEQYSKNDSMLKLHLVLEDLSFLSTNKSYNLLYESGEDIATTVKNDQLKIANFLNMINKNAFADLSVSEQEEFLNLLKNSEIQSRRAMYVKIRALYLSTIYDSPIGEKIAKIKLPSKVRADLEVFMKTHPLNIPKVETLKKYDVVVVGSGPAGAVIAYELEQKGKSVLLLEGGSFYHPGAIESRKFSEFRESFGNRFTDDDSLVFRAGNVSGGGSSVNIDLAFSPELPEVRKQLELWKNLGHTEGNQYSPEKIKEAYRYIAEKVGTRTPPLEEMNANNSILYNGAKKSGLDPQLYDLNTYDPLHSADKISDKKSALEAFILPAIKNKDNPLHFRPDAIVENILFAEDGKTVRGLKVKIHKPVDVPGVINNPMGLNFPED